MNTEQPLTMGFWNRSEMPSFHTLPELEKWFDGKYCGFNRVAVIGPSPMPPEKIQQMAEAAAPAAVRKMEWLRQNNNEEWYAPRYAIAVSVWDELKHRHEAIIGEQVARQRKAEQELVKVRECLDEVTARAKNLEKECEAKSERIAFLGETIRWSFGSIRKIRSLKKVAAAFKDILEFKK